MAGVHWRSDHTESIKLGEQVALCIPKNQKRSYHEKDWSFTLTTFKKVPIKVSKKGITRIDNGRNYHLVC
jgi:hypothetical protein